MMIDIECFRKIQIECNLHCSGSYGDHVSLETLKHFHRRRVQVLAASGADFIAFETIPNKLEAKVYF